VEQTAAYFEAKTGPQLQWQQLRPCAWLQMDAQEVGQQLGACLCHEKMLPEANLLELLTMSA